MSMREYPIEGFGISKKHLKLNISKIEKELGYKEGDLSEESFYDQDIFNEMFLGSVIDVCWNDYEFYIMIYASMPWKFNKDEEFEKLKGEKHAKEYIWEHLRKYVDNSKEEVINNCDYISDTYCG